MALEKRAFQDISFSSLTEPAAGTTSAAGEELPRNTPPEPRTVSDLGVNRVLLEELVLKEIYFAGRPTASDMCRSLAVPFSVVKEILEPMKREHLIDVTGVQGPFQELYEYCLTEKGWDKIRDCLTRNQYRGPVPVPLAQYQKIVREQTVRNQSISREALHNGLSHLVLDPEFVDQFGPALNSGGAIFLYGAPGNGKSTIAFSLGKLLPGPVLIPHAIEAGGQIIAVFDPAVHRPLVPISPVARAADERHRPDRGRELQFDRRWVISSRPVVIVGGELTLQRLELQYDPQLRYHLAPTQMKANGGLFVIDDFGRQRVSPVELLNRWIVPMDRGIDYLTLQTGETVEIPFDLLLVLSTNIEPAEVIDEVFLRRIPHKIMVPGPTMEQFVALFHSEAAIRNITLEEGLVHDFIEEYFDESLRPMRFCHPRDITANVESICRYEGYAPQASRALLLQAADAFFRAESHKGPSKS
ncbi:MAG TPA: ATP-binding protein [Dehalococcoidia bacterium]|nr:ATP-binding protein [Dehalococcoidia bacterium]